MFLPHAVAQQYRGYKQCSESDRYAIDSWYNSQMADLRRRGLTFSGAAVALQNEYQLKINWCEEDNNNYAQALIDYEECLKQAEEQKEQCLSLSWSCGDWGTCSSNGMKYRTCNKILDCEGGVSSPATTQSCTYTPACTADTWQCGNWGTCSPQGVQTRNCNRTYDCQSAETAAPATSQYCEAPNQPKQQTPPEDLGIANQDSIVKATVKLICPVSSTMASQGSGTVINSTGLILTNKHVVDGTAGCWVGFIDDYSDEPYFGDRQIADIYKVSSDADAAVLKLRNPNNKTLSSVNISQSNSGSIKLGEILTTYGYPAKFGTKITYTSGDFSGVDGDYLKTTAIIEHGNSGGGAYLKNGAFIGIPTAVVKGSLNSMGYLLSVNKVNSWLNNSIAYNYNTNDNNYSRVSALLEDMDLSAISSLGLFVAGDEENITTQTESQKVIQEEKTLITKIDKNLSKRVIGNILLQVEK
ncbi:serine protease, partial [Patescibacteria group bacterium]|nr:serine protease [Patescibacteria group bacterium]